MRNLLLQHLLQWVVRLSEPWLAQQVKQFGDDPITLDTAPPHNEEDAAEYRTRHQAQHNEKRPSHCPNNSKAHNQMWETLFGHFVCRRLLLNDDLRSAIGIRHRFCGSNFDGMLGVPGTRVGVDRRLGHQPIRERDVENARNEACNT